jgi:hypothetical protein
MFANNLDIKHQNYMGEKTLIEAYLSKHNLNFTRTTLADEKNSYNEAGHSLSVKGHTYLPAR